MIVQPVVEPMEHYTALILIIIPAQLAASVMERKTCLETRGREVTRKRLLIQRLRMAVVTMHDYVRRDAVVLPGDKRWTPSSL